MLDLTKQSTDDPKEVRIYPKGLEAMGKIERPHLGMKMYAVDQRTRECEEAKYKTVSLPVTSVPNNKMNLIKQTEMVHTAVHMQVVFDTGKYYCWAINKKSAVRKFVRALRQAMEAAGR